MKLPAAAAPVDMADRVVAIASWWSQLDLTDRRSAQQVALTGDQLPAPMFRQLVDAHVLAVSVEQYARVEAGGSSFPMPRDIRQHVLTHAE